MVTEIELFESPDLTPLGFCLWGWMKSEVNKRKVDTARGSVRSTRGLGPTMTARGQSIGILIGMLPQTLIMSRLDNFRDLAHEFSFFIIHKIFSCLWTAVFFNRNKNVTTDNAFGLIN